MNVPVLTPFPQPRPLLASDVMFLVENGLIDPNARFELLDGVIIPMASKGRFHEVIREELMDWLRQPWAQNFRITVEHTLILDTETIVEPDFILYDAHRKIADAPLTGPELRLVIEVADTSINYDLNEKAAKYAASGITDYWVINAQTRVTRVHRAAQAGTWTDVRDVAAGEAVRPLCAPSAELKL